MSKRERFRQYIFVIKELTSREIKRKYSRSYLGILWSVLNPLLSMAVVSAIFSTIFKRSIENFPIYYLTGITVWQLFTGATNTAMTGLVDNKTLLIKVKLPMQIFPLARVYTAFVNFGYSLIAFVIMLIVFRVKPGLTMLGLVPNIFFLMLFVTGISYILAIAYIFFGDIKHLYTVILTLWMYSSAIFYPIDSIHGIMKVIITENPIFNYIAGARACILYGEWPTEGQWIRMAVWGITVFVIGSLFFKKYKNLVMQKI